MHVKIINIPQQGFIRQELKTLTFLHISIIFKGGIEGAVGGDANSSGGILIFKVSMLSLPISLLCIIVQ